MNSFLCTEFDVSNIQGILTMLRHFALCVDYKKQMMKSSNDHSNDIESQEKKVLDNLRDLNDPLRKRQVAKSSFDIEGENGVHPTTTEDNEEINQLQIRYSKRRRNSFSTTRTQTHNDMIRGESCGRRLSESHINESKIKANYTGKLVARDSHSVATLYNNSPSITPAISYHSLKPHSDEQVSKSDSYRVGVSPSIIDQHDTNRQTSNIDGTIGFNENLQHHINTIGVNHTLPYITIEVGEQAPVLSSSENFPEVRRSTSPLDHMVFSLPPTPPTLTNLVLNHLTRSSDHLLSLLTLQNISRWTAIDPLIASNPFARDLLVQETMQNPSMSRFSLPFGSPFRNIYIPPWFDTLALLNVNEPLILRSWFERLSTSHGIPIPHSIVADEENHSNLITSHASRVQHTDGVHASNITRQNINGTEPVFISSYRTLQHLLGTESTGIMVPQCLPFTLALPDDTRKLSSLQVLLRQQIEFFSASEDDLLTHARGRNKPITLKQVGIRCRHCANLALKRRKKGSVYFPFTLLGIYQAAQNMASTHFTKDNCNENLSEIKSMITLRLGCKSSVGSGKEFWADAARILGLLDTELGIRFIRDLVADSEQTRHEAALR
jgi:hypothetical protein